MTERRVADTVLLKMAASTSAGNKVNEPSQSAARICTAKAHQQTVSRFSIKLAIASLALGPGVALEAMAGQGGLERSESNFEVKTRLTTVQIIDAFSNVIDRGEVQDQRGISAETHWHADGRFVSRWWQTANDGSRSPQQSVTGRWRAENNLRCVSYGFNASSDWSCAEVWLLADGRYLSLDPDGSIHGLHIVTRLNAQAP